MRIAELKNASLVDLVVLAQEGDEAAYTVLTQRFQGMARGYAFQYLKDYHLAEDAVQEAFLEMHRCLSSLREPAAFPGWFRRIMFKNCDRMTRGKRIQTVPLDCAAEASAATPGPDDAAEAHEARIDVTEALDRLPAHERIVAVLFHVHGYSHKDISAFLDIPISTVKNRVGSSRHRLDGAEAPDVVAKGDESVDYAPRSLDVVSRLLSRPRCLEIQNHPVRRAWDYIQSAWPEYEIVSGEEIENYHDVFGHDPKSVEECAFYLSGKNILRYQMFDVVAKAARDRSRPLRLMSAGRVFYFQPDDPVRWVNHEVDGIEICATGTYSDYRERFSRMIVAAIGPGRLEWKPVRLNFSDDAAQLLCRRGGRVYDVGGLGLFKHGALGRLVKDSRRLTAFAFGIRLDSIAMLRHGIEDAQSLWSKQYI